MSRAPKKAGGRPKKAAGERFQSVTFRFPPAMIEAIDGQIAERVRASGGLEVPDRSAIVRELLAKALGEGKRK